MSIDGMSKNDRDVLTAFEDRFATFKSLKPLQEVLGRLHFGTWGFGRGVENQEEKPIPSIQQGNRQVLHIHG